MRDPTSWAHSAVAEWKHPVSHEYFVLADQFDAFTKVNFKKPTPYPRPQPESGPSLERIGTVINPDDLGDVLRGFGRDPETLLSAGSGPAGSA